MANQTIKLKLIASGVKNLHEFGYPEVTLENIMTDEVYSAFFKSMLKDNLGQNNSIDDAVNELINELNVEI